MVVALPEFKLLLISSLIKFWFVIVDPKYLKRVNFSNYLFVIFQKHTTSSITVKDVQMCRRLHIEATGPLFINAICQLEEERCLPSVTQVKLSFVT
jgi:hypothetical protein